MRKYRRFRRLKESTDLYDIQKAMNSGSIKLIKVVSVIIEYFDKGYRDVGEDDLTNFFERYYTNIHDILMDVEEKVGLSSNISNYSFLSSSPSVIRTSGLFNQDYDIPSSEEMDDYERGRIDLYDGVLSIEIQVLKYSEAGSDDMKSLGLRQM